MAEKKTLWELLWDYDPNGLVVIDETDAIRVVNASFCAMFKVQPEQIIGQPANLLLGDLTDFHTVREQGLSIKGKEKEYSPYNLFVRNVIFPVRDQGLVACIMVDLTNEHQRQEEMVEMKQQLIAQVNRVIEKQMSIAQEIASLLGETTADAKVSLLKIRNVLNEEIK